MNRSSLIVLIACSMVVFQTACSVGDNGGTTNPEEGAFLMANISPDATPLNIFINNSLLDQGFAYGSYTPYYTAVAGSYALSFTNAANASVLSNSINIEANKSYSYILIDSFSKIKSTFFEDVLVRPAADSVYIRFFNFSPNSQLFHLRDSVANKILYTNRSFNDQAANSTYTNFMRLKAGSYTFQLLNQDSSRAASKQYNLEGGHIFSLFAKGFVDSTNTQAIGLGQIQNY